MLLWFVAALMEFLSTPSARRATQCLAYPRSIGTISIHALREEGDSRARIASCCTSISIHALREEGDRLGFEVHTIGGNFYPRPPRGGRPRTRPGAATPSNFYPRPPRGGRLVVDASEFKRQAFLSTPSARRATVYARGVP